MIEQFFKENEIPYQEFAKLGYTREMIRELSRKNLEQLLSGRRTSLLPINHIEGHDREFDIKAKFSLKRNSDGSVSLMIHPVRESIENDIKLSAYELNKVKEGHVILKKIEGEKYMVQLDKENNELLKVKAKDIMIPHNIGDIELSSTQREHLKKGNPILLEDTNYKIAVSIDLNSRSGLKAQNLNDMTLAEKIAFDRVNPGIIGYLQTDENRNEYMQVQRQNESHSEGQRMKFNQG
jgi:hypothetical protein